MNYYRLCYALVCACARAPPRGGERAHDIRPRIGQSASASRGIGGVGAGDVDEERVAKCATVGIFISPACGLRAGPSSGHVGRSLSL